MATILWVIFSVAGAMTEVSFLRILGHKPRHATPQPWRLTHKLGLSARVSVALGAAAGLLGIDAISAGMFALLAVIAGSCLVILCIVLKVGDVARVHPGAPHPALLND